MRETFTVRKQSFGVGVERTFPIHSPKIERIEVTAIGDVNRAKLYYLRGKVGKRARVRAKRGVALPESEMLEPSARPPEDEPVDEEAAPKQPRSPSPRRAGGDRSRSRAEPSPRSAAEAGRRARARAGRGPSRPE